MDRAVVGRAWHAAQSARQPGRMSGSKLLGRCRACPASAPPRMRAGQGCESGPCCPLRAGGACPPASALGTGRLMASNAPSPQGGAAARAPVLRHRAAGGHNAVLA